MKNEVKVGIFVIAAAVILIAGIIIVGQVRLFKRGYTVAIDFSFLGDLRAGAKVQYRGGFAIGYVDKVEITTNDMVRVTTIIEDTKIPLYQNCKFAIYTVGMGLGEKYILVIPPVGVPGDKLKHGDVVRGNDPLSLEGAISSLSDITKEFSKEEFVGFLKGTLSMFVDLSEIIHESKKSVIVMSKELSLFSADIRIMGDVVVSNKDSINEAIARSTGAIRNMDIALSNATSMVISINRIAKQLDDGKTGIGRLLKDDKIYEDLKISSKNLREFTERIKDNPNLLLFPSDDRRNR
ncbi:MAG: MlaD family protein [Spirochaetota bacterium]